MKLDITLPSHLSTMSSPSTAVVPSFTTPSPSPSTTPSSFHVPSSPYPSTTSLSSPLHHPITPKDLAKMLLPPVKDIEDALRNGMRENSKEDRKVNNTRKKIEKTDKRGEEKSKARNAGKWKCY